MVSYSIIAFAILLVAAVSGSVQYEQRVEQLGFHRNLVTSMTPPCDGDCQMMVVLPISTSIYVDIDELLEWQTFGQLCPARSDGDASRCAWSIHYAEPIDVEKPESFSQSHVVFFHSPVR